MSDNGQINVWDPFRETNPDNKTEEWFKKICSGIPLPTGLDTNYDNIDSYAECKQDVSWIIKSTNPTMESSLLEKLEGLDFANKLEHALNKTEPVPSRELYKLYNIIEGRYLRDNSYITVESVDEFSINEKNEITKFLNGRAAHQEITNALAQFAGTEAEIPQVKFKNEKYNEYLVNYFKSLSLDINDQADLEIAKSLPVQTQMESFLEKVIYYIHKKDNIESKQKTIYQHLFRYSKVYGTILIDIQTGMPELRIIHPRNIILPPSASDTYEDSVYRGYLMHLDFYELLTYFDISTTAIERLLKPKMTNWNNKYTPNNLFKREYIYTDDDCKRCINESFKTITVQYIEIMSSDNVEDGFVQKIRSGYYISILNQVFKYNNDSENEILDELGKPLFKTFGIKAKDTSFVEIAIPDINQLDLICFKLNEEIASCTPSGKNINIDSIQDAADKLGLTPTQLLYISKKTNDYFFTTSNEENPNKFVQNSHSKLDGIQPSTFDYKAMKRDAQNELRAVLGISEMDDVNRPEVQAVGIQKLMHQATLNNQYHLTLSATLFFEKYISYLHRYIIKACADSGITFYSTLKKIFGDISHIFSDNDAARKYAFVMIPRMNNDLQSFLSNILSQLIAKGVINSGEAMSILQEPNIKTIALHLSVLEKKAMAVQQANAMNTIQAQTESNAQIQAAKYQAQAQKDIAIEKERRITELEKLKSINAAKLQLDANKAQNMIGRSDRTTSNRIKEKFAENEIAKTEGKPTSEESPLAT